MLSRFKFWSVEGFIARTLRIVALTCAATGMTDWAMQAAAIYGVVEVFGIKKMLTLMKKGKKKNGTKKGRR